MRLITHNSLRCNRKDVTLGYPLGLEITQMEIEETDVNFDFVRHLIPGLYWPGVVLAARAVGLEGLPEAFSAEILEDEGVLQVLHRLLFDTHVIEGTLVCPESGQRFPITDGIPNMNMPEELV